ncbi:hypothetical protein HZS_7004, partial [Henneguya salminicola]
MLFLIGILIKIIADGTCFNEFDINEASECKNITKSTYEFRARELDLTDISLEKYKNKILLIANIASFWKYPSHYIGLNSIKEEFGLINNSSSCSFDVIAFPCHQFGSSEPSNNHEVLNCLKYVRPGNGYEPNFKVFAKIFVNGEDEHPLFRYLKNACPSPSGYIAKQFTLLWQLVRNNDIVWNFEKFLIDHRGIPYKRYMPHVHPLRLKSDIKSLIS